MSYQWFEHSRNIPAEVLLSINKMYQRLPTLELGFYFVVFVTSQLYSLIRFYRAAQDQLGQILLLYPEDFEVECGHRHFRWPLPWSCNQPRDVTDLEWQAAKQYYLDWKILLLIGHCIGFKLTNHISPKVLSTFVIAYSTACLAALLGAFSLALIYANIFISILILDRIPGKLVKYIFFVLTIFANNLYHATPSDPETNLLFNLCISWLNAKLLSASLDTLEDSHSGLRTHHCQPIRTRLAYLFYFPAFFFGPIYHYSDFANSTNKSELSISKLLQIGRCLFWAAILDHVLKYCLYSSAFLNYPFLLVQLDHWAVAGFGFSLMLLFFCKYYVLYGISNAIGQFDGFDEGVFAPPPHCIAHMNKTSYLWRKFDQGLYGFLVKYFYKPLTGANHSNPIRRMVASAVCFTIIAVWHEQMESYSVIAWVVVNFVLLNLETFAAILRRSAWFVRIEKSISPLNQSRIEATLGSPYLAMAYLSNILFLSNEESVLVIIEKFASLWPLVTLLGSLYAGCHVCKYINGRLAVSANQKKTLNGI